MQHNGHVSSQDLYLRYQLLSPQFSVSDEGFVTFLLDIHHPSRTSDLFVDVLLNWNGRGPSLR